MDTDGYYVTNGMVYDPAGLLVARIPGRVDLATSAGLDVVRELERQRAENARLRRLLERAMPQVKCEGFSTDPCVRCQISRTVAGDARHVYPHDRVK